MVATLVIAISFSMKFQAEKTKTLQSQFLTQATKTEHKQIDSKKTSSTPLASIATVNSIISKLDDILDPTIQNDQRRKALQTLIEKGAENILAVSKITLTEIPKFKNKNNPHSIDSYNHSFEKNLRITAIEALDLWSTQGIDVEKYLIAIINRQNDKELIFLASISLSGIQNGRPGKLGRFIDAIFDEALSKK